ncbi:MAG: LAGLIDADG family homing endonuclease, partial [Nitrososphaera sp.]
CLPVADSIAAIGRSTIHKAIDKCREIGIEVVYSDSVLPDTPIVIRRKDRSIDIVPIESLIPKTHTPNRYDKFGKLEVLTESGFSRIKYAYRHKVKKKGYRILTRKGYVECTEDHSLVIDGREVTPAKLKVGDRVDQVPFKTESKIAINSDLAWLFGFFVAEGTCGAYRNHLGTPDLVKYSWRIVNLDEEKLRRAQTIIQQCLGLETTIIDIRKSSATYGLVPKGEAKLLVDYFKVMCYRGSEKAVPRVVLNAHVEAKKAFIEGLVSGDGTMDRSGILSLDQIHKSIIAGMTSMLEELHIEHTIDTRSDKPNVCRLRVIRDTADPRIMPADVIRKIETFDIEGQVYDLETENHHFCGGVGNILLHNTDSIFLKEPSSTAVEEMATWAHGTLGVDLEVDKEYRYVVFSDLKKNYLGVKPDGTVDVKGLTGK